MTLSHQHLLAPPVVGLQRQDPPPALFPPRPRQQAAEPQRVSGAPPAPVNPSNNVVNQQQNFYLQPARNLPPPTRQPMPAADIQPHSANRTDVSTVPNKTTTVATDTVPGASRKKAFAEGLKTAVCIISVLFDSISFELHLTFGVRFLEKECTSIQKSKARKQLS